MFWYIDKYIRRRRQSEKELEGSEKRKVQRYEFKLADLWPGLRGSVLSAIVIGVITEGVAWIVLGVVFGLIAGLLRALLTGLVVWVVIVIAGSIGTWRSLMLQTQNRDSALSPITSWRTMRKSNYAGGLISGFVVATGTGLVAWIALGLVHGLVIGALAGILSGLLSALANLTWPLLASVQLTRRWRTPVRLMKFLDDAYRRGVLRTVGPLYQFRHARLQDRLANQDTETALPDSKTSGSNA